MPVHNRSKSPKGFSNGNFNDRLSAQEDARKRQLEKVKKKAEALKASEPERIARQKAAAEARAKRQAEREAEKQAQAERRAAEKAEADRQKAEAEAAAEEERERLLAEQKARRDERYAKRKARKK